MLCNVRGATHLGAGSDAQVLGKASLRREYMSKGLRDEKELALLRPGGGASRRGSSTCKGHPEDVPGVCEKGREGWEGWGLVDKGKEFRFYL